MKKRRKIKEKIAQSLYHNGNLQKSAVEFKKSIDTVLQILDNGTKKKK